MVELGNMPMLEFLFKPLRKEFVTYTLNKAIKEVNRYRVWNANKMAITFPKVKVTIREKIL